MSQPFESATIRFYDEHAEEYINSTVNTDMRSLYRPFLDLLPDGGAILDAGCGSGRDTKALLDMEFDVVSIDASEKMVEATTRLIGRAAMQLCLQEMDFRNEFDGVWACASLLHVPMAEIDDVLSRIAGALRFGGVCYMSFKEGEGERQDGDRQFTDFTANSLTDCITSLQSLEIVRIWKSEDVRPNRTECWVNAIVQKGKQPQKRAMLEQSNE